MEQTKNNVIKTHLMIGLGWLLTFLLYVVFTTSRVLKSPLWWIPQNKFSIWMRSPEIIREQSKGGKEPNVPNEIALDSSISAWAGIIAIAWGFFGWFWALMALILFLIIGVIVFIIIARKIKEFKTKNE